MSAARTVVGLILLFWLSYQKKMTIHDLFKHLRNFNRPEEDVYVISTTHKSYLCGKTAAVDISGILHAHFSTTVKNVTKGLNLSTQDLDREAIISHWLESLLNWGLGLVNMGCRIVCVFDGEAPPEKAATQAKRRKQREAGEVKFYDKLAEINAVSRLERTPKMLEELQKAAAGQFHVSKEDQEKVKEIYRAAGFDVVQARGEAERTCASLELNGIVDLVISTDSDCLAHGINCLVSKLLRNDKIEIVILQEVLQALRLDFGAFQELCIASWCDYNLGIPGARITTLYPYFLELGSYEAVRKATPHWDHTNVLMEETLRLFSYQDPEESIVDYQPLETEWTPYYLCTLPELLDRYQLGHMRSRFDYTITNAYSLLKTQNSESQEEARL